MKITDIFESTTTSGAIAPGAPAKIGKTQKRAGSLFKGKVTNKPFYEGKMKELDIDLKELSDKEFLAKYKKTKDDVRKELKEDEITEQDLILVPDQIIKKDKGFVPHEKDRRDHEVEMARSELFAATKDAQRIYKMLQGRTEDEGLMGWQQSYITLAADYLNSVADSLEHKAATEGAGVLAGGMSNFEEGVRDLGYDAQSLIMKLRRDVEEKRLQPTPQAVLAAARELAGDMDFAPQLLVKQVLGQGVAEGKCPKCGGPAFSEEHIAEAKDACYHKVKSRYKVWPSAYASGALVKCRKVGASNWGNKSKK
jgi:hypothetical protein